HSHQPCTLIRALDDWRMTMEDLLQRITVDPKMAFGKPTIRGLCYSVEWLLELLSSGMSQQQRLRCGSRCYSTSRLTNCSAMTWRSMPAMQAPRRHRRVSLQ